MATQFAHTISTGHSASVKMSLHIGDSTFPILQSSADAIKLPPSVQPPQGDAVVEIIVDGRSHRRAVRLLSSHPQPYWVSIVDL